MQIKRDYVVHALTLSLKTNISFLTVEIAFIVVLHVFGAGLLSKYGFFVGFLGEGFLGILGG